jgi:phage tail-like protein
MNSNPRSNFAYLAGDGRWPLFERRGLELREDGALQLHSLPLFEGELPAELRSAPEPVGPAGIGVDVDGTVYFSDPPNDRLIKIEGCGGAALPVDCVGGRGSAPAQLDTPRGLMIAKHRRSLFVADSGNHRVQVFDLATLQLVDVWGQAEVAGTPRPGQEPGLFDTPVALAGDSDGNVYIVDYGNRRVQKFNRAGDPVSSFWETIAQATAIEKPVDIAVYSDDEATRVYIVDEAAHSVYVFDAEGNPARDAYGRPASFGADELKEPLGIAASRDAIYVGDKATGRVLKFAASNYDYFGAAVNYKGPVAALSFDIQGDLLVHTGGGAPPLRLASGKGYRTRGAMWSGPIRPRNFALSWHTLRAEVGLTAASARVQFFVHTSNSESDAPEVDPSSDDPFADPRWRPRAVAPGELENVSDLFIGGAPAAFLWVGALFSSDGLSTPVLSQARVEFDHEDYRSRLPAIYRGESPCGDFLLRFLSLFESFFAEVESSIDDLSQLFDTEAAPREYLPWLASWLALRLDEEWSEQEQRQAIASAFENYGRRGTLRGLGESLRSLAGVTAIIEEPVSSAALWAMPAEDQTCGCRKEGGATKEKAWIATESSILGVTTSLAPAQAQGAVIGSTTVLDATHLITNEEFGASLFDDVAYQFSVQVYRGGLSCPETLPRIRAVIEQEKPAHTDYHLCIIEPLLRVGFQARVGIDAVVAGPGPPAGLSDGAVLGGSPPGRVGERGLLGVTTRVG